MEVDGRVALCVARFYEELAEALEASARETLAAAGLQASDRFDVPGAFELPLAAKYAAQSGRYAAVICLGAVIRGDTPHFDFVAGEAARGIQQVAISQSLPVIFGVLTTNTEQQALDRIGGSHGHAGESAAEAALEMIAVLARIQP